MYIWGGGGGVDMLEALFSIKKHYKTEKYTESGRGCRHSNGGLYSTPRWGEKISQN